MTSHCQIKLTRKSGLIVGSLRRHNVWSITLSPTLTGMLSLIRPSGQVLDTRHRSIRFLQGSSRSQYGRSTPDIFLSANERRDGDEPDAHAGHDSELL